MTAIDEIKSRLDIVDIVSETVKLRRSGKNYTGFCPFHTNTRTPAFVVFPESGTWRCFSCNEGGDIFNFLMKKEGWDFSQVLQSLATRTGVQLEPLTPEKRVEDEHQERLRTLLDEVVTYYRHHLLQSQAGRPALNYLTRRGLTSATIEQFGLGYAPNSWETTHQYFLQKNYQGQELMEAGLVGEREETRTMYDRFRNRIMFPIRDAMGRMAGFGARALSDDDMPKYLNSPQTLLFDKSRLLYGLDLARKSIRKEDQVVIVEGYMDVIGLHQGGFANAVSPMGTALNEFQFRMLKRFTRRIILALDPDAAGEKATLRGLEMAREALDHSSDFVPGADGLFDARGLIRHEARLQADLRITSLPAGKDPDEIALQEPETWKRIIAEAQPVVQHVMNVLASGQNLEDPKVKRSIAEKVLPLIADVPNAVERDAYRQQLARLLRVDERALVASSSPAKPGDRRSGRIRRYVERTPQMLVSAQEKVGFDLEMHCLRLLLRQPEAVHQVDRALQKADLSRFTFQDFQKAEHQVLMRLIQKSLEQDHLEPRQFIHDGIPEAFEALIKELQQPFLQPEPTSIKQVEELARTVLRLRQVRIREGLDQLRSFQQEMQPQDELSMASYREMIVDYSRTREKLDLALNKPLQLD